MKVTGMDLQFELAAHGMRRASCGEARRALNPRHHISCSRYVYICRRMMEEEGIELPECSWPGGLIAVGYNHYSPTRWVRSGLLERWVRFWWNAAARPETVNSSYNPYPETMFRLWEVLHHPETLGFIVEGNVSRAVRLIKANRFREAMLVLKHEPVGSLMAGDLKRLARAGERVRWIILRDIQRQSEDHKVVEDVMAPVEEDGYTYNKWMGCRVNWEAVRDILDDEDRFFAEYCPPGLKWKLIQGYVPKNYALKELPLETVRAFNKKQFLKAYKSLNKIEAEGDRVRGALGLTLLFGGNWRSWVQYMERRGVSQHDATYWLPQIPSPGLGEALRRWKDAGIADLAIIARGWNAIADKAGNFKETLAAARSLSYSNVKDSSIAMLAAEFGYPQVLFEEIQDEWLKAKRDWVYEEIPAVEAERDGYRMYRLDKSDPRGIFLGNFTDCCQHPGGAGESCAWYGVRKPNSGFYVVEDRSGKIIAQSWVWRDDKGNFVFDNIEVLGEFQNRAEKLIALYEEVANKLLGKLGIRRVLVGMGNSDVEAPWVQDVERLNLQATLGSTYTDAWHRCVVASLPEPFDIEDISF